MSRFWQFAQLSDAYKDHSFIDQIPQAGDTGKLFIGGLKVIDRPDLLEDNRITHILSVLEYDHCDEEYAKYRRLWISAEDSPGQNLLQHFDRSNAFIEQALAGGGHVLVHCAMGVSRSATIACAYLMYKSRPEMTFLQALGQLQESRPLCAPNVGFAEQLETYERMLKAPNDANRQSIYSQWLEMRTGNSKL